MGRSFRPPVVPSRSTRPSKLGTTRTTNSLPLRLMRSAVQASSHPLSHRLTQTIHVVSDSGFCGHFPLRVLLFIMSISVLMHAVRSLWLILLRYGVLGTPENMSPDSSSSLFPDRPIRPLPKRRIRERLSPDVADSIKYPPAPQANTPLFIYPYNSREDLPAIGIGAVGAISRDSALKTEGGSVLRRSGAAVSRDDGSSMAQPRRVLSSRASHEPADHGFRVPPRSVQSRQPKPPSTASSADGYDSFENTNNKKKRKIPIAGETILSGTHVLNEPASFGIPSPPPTADGDSGDHIPTSTPYYQAGGPLSNGQGISGPGRGRYGRIRNGRSPLRALSDSNANWPGRNTKSRSQYPSPPAGKYNFVYFGPLHCPFPSGLCRFYCSFCIIPSIGPPFLHCRQPS